MSIQLYLHLAEPAGVAAPRPRSEFAALIDAVEALWPATLPRIATRLGATEAEAGKLLRAAIAAGVLRRSGTSYHATEAGLRGAGRGAA